MAGKSKRKSERELKPKLRFPEFHDASPWTENKFGNVCDNISSGKDKTEIAGEYDLYGSTGIIGKTASGSYSGEYILVARVGANAGLLTKANGTFGVTDNTLVIHLNRKSSIDFVSCYLEFVGLNKLVFGSGQPLITGGQLKALPIQLPEPAEQSKIAGCLSSLDELIGAESRKLEALQAHKKGLMQQLFPREGETLPRLRFPEFKDAPEWEPKRLDGIGRVIRGSSPRPQGDSRYYGGPVPRLMVQDVTRDGKWVTPRIDSLTLEGAELSRPCPAGTLTIVCSGTVGIVSFLAVDACIHDGFLALVDIDETIVTKDFLFHVLSTLRDKFQKGATHGGVFTNLTTSGIKEFEVTCPSEPEQSRIADFLTSLDDVIAAQSQRLKELGSHKKGLMQQLFPSMEDADA